jgi:hypothetical protein
VSISDAARGPKRLALLHDVIRIATLSRHTRPRRLLRFSVRLVHICFLTPDRHKQAINATTRRSVVANIVVARESFVMTPDQARQRAEKSFRPEERTRDARKAMAEYETQAIATRKKTAHLKALRLAKETLVLEAQGLDSKPNR